MLTTSGQTRPFLGSAIQLLRKKAELSARGLSLKAGLSPAYIYKLEAGQLEPSLKAFGRIALALKMSPAEAWTCLVAEANER